MTHSKPINSTASVPTIPPPFCLNKKFCKTSIEDSYKPSIACNQTLTQPGFRDGNTLLEKSHFDMKVDRLPLTSKFEDSYDALLLGYQDTKYFARTHKKNLAKVANLNTGKQKKTLVHPRVQEDVQYDNRCHFGTSPNKLQGDVSFMLITDLIKNSHSYDVQTSEVSND